MGRFAALAEFPMVRDQADLSRFERRVGLDDLPQLIIMADLAPLVALALAHGREEFGGVDQLHLADRVIKARLTRVAASRLVGGCEDPSRSGADDTARSTGEQAGAPAGIAPQAAPAAVPVDEVARTLTIVLDHHSDEVRRELFDLLLQTRPPQLIVTILLPHDADDNDRRRLSELGLVQTG
jgi:hypothetical protein